MRIYLADLIYQSVGTYVVPLNVSYIGAYAKAAHGDKISVSIFKEPEELLDAVDAQPPDVVGFSNYSWNFDLSRKVAGYIKGRHPLATTVMGGPGIRDTDPSQIKALLSANPAIDAYILLEGEQGFANLVGELFKTGSFAELRKRDGLIPGCVYLSSAGELRLAEYAYVEELEQIPSPYLTGLLDKFLTNKFIPLFETNRGCPFACTFCTWGKSERNKVRKFDLERAYREFDYVRRKNDQISLWILADANFGMLPRDMEIADRLSGIMSETPALKRVSYWTAKNRSSANRDILSKLSGLGSRHLIAIQTHDPEVQKLVKRDNIRYDNIKEMVRETRELGMMSSTDLLCGLPGETKASHIETLRKTFDAGFDFISINTIRMLPGSEMEEDASRKKHRLGTKYRLIDGAYGIYRGMKCFEAEEGIRSTSAMSEEEMFYFRIFHWLVWFGWNCGFFQPLLKFYQSKGVNPADFIDRIILSDKSAFPEIQDLFDRFQRDARAEWFESENELRAHYSQDAAFEALLKDGFFKMNVKYTGDMIFGAALYRQFVLLLRSIAEKLDPLQEAPDFIFDLTASLLIDPDEIVTGDIQSKKFRVPAAALPCLGITPAPADAAAWTDVLLHKSQPELEKVRGLFGKFDYAADPENAVRKVQEWFSQGFRYDVMLSSSDLSAAPLVETALHSDEVYA